MNPREYAKALIPLVVMVILVPLAAIGLRPEMSIEEALTLLVTSGLVWLVPNRS